jgi:methyl-accepting chemotaxis protein
MLTTLHKDADEFGTSDLVAGSKESMLLMYRNIEMLAGALRSRRLSTEEVGKFDSAIDSNKNETLKKIDKIKEKIYTEFKSASDKQAQAVLDLQKTLLGLVLVVLATLFIAGLSTVRSLMASMAKVNLTMTKSTKEMRQTSDRLADSSQKMATSTAESAAAIQESVSSMAEMTAMLKQTSQHTESASDLAQQILTKSDEGSRVMSDLSDSMTKISLANARLADITKIIDDIRGRTNLINEIVFKTQLLSVNASIEAARAGHHGKGFSVVANEVANLATMSGKAANEIGTLLHESTSKVATIVDGTSNAVKGGEHICRNAVQMFALISESIGEISDKVGQIDIATKEQETGIRQTSAALAQMNSATTSTSHVARDNAHLGTLLLKQCDRMVSATSLLNTTIYGQVQAEATIEVREPIAEARSIAMEDHQVDLDLDKIISMNQADLATALIDKIKVNGPGSYKGTGTDG